MHSQITDIIAFSRKMCDSAGSSPDEATVPLRGGEDSARLPCQRTSGTANSDGYLLLLPPTPCFHLQGAHPSETSSALILFNISTRNTQRTCVTRARVRVTRPQ